MCSPSLDHSQFTNQLLQTYFESNLSLLGLTAASRQDIVDWSMFTSEVSNELTQQRSAMKTKVHDSFLSWGLILMRIN